MDRDKNKTRRFWYGMAALTLLVGWLVAAALAISTLAGYPSAIGEAYEGGRQTVEVPGVADLELTREGAYGVYYEGVNGAYVHSEWPPQLDCRLTAGASGDNVPLVPDYVPGNRYSTRDGRIGVLIYSTTVQEAGRYTLSCDDPLATSGSTYRLAIGPNYVFELLRVAWHLGGKLLVALALFCASTLLSTTIVVVSLTLRVRNARGRTAPPPRLE